MTVSTSTSRVAYSGDGVSVAFSVPFLFLANADIAVYVNGAELTTGFTTTGAGVGTGTVTFAAAPAAAASIVLVRDPDFLQSTALPSNGPFPSQSVERMADKAMIGEQRLYDLFGRALSISDGEPALDMTLPGAAARLGRLLAFDATTGEPEASDFTSTQIASAIAAAYLGGAATTLDALAFVQSGTGATSRSAQAKMREWVSPEDFGAVGNGVSDDTTPVQRALNTGKWLRGTPGATYLVQPLTQTTADQLIEFVGCTLKLKAASSSFILSLGGARAMALGGTYDGNKAAGQSTSSGYYDHAAVYLGATGAQAVGVRSTNSAGLAIKGGAFDKLRVANCDVPDFSVQGIFVQSAGRDSTGVVIEGNRVTIAANTGIGIYLIGDPVPTTFKQRRWRISGNVVEGPTAGTTVKDVCITVRAVDGVCSDNVTNGGDMGISCDITDRSVISNNRIGPPSGTTSYGIEVNGQRNTVTGNYITGAKYGVIGSGSQQAMDGNTVSGNVFDCCTVQAVKFQPSVGNTARYLNITGNTILTTAGVAAEGIRLTRDCKYSTVQGNIFVGPGSGVGFGTAIYLDTVGGYCSVMGNRFMGWERPLIAYDPAAVAQVSLSFLGNDCSQDMLSSSLFISAAGAATIGTRCVQIGNVGVNGIDVDYFDRGTGLLKLLSNGGTPEGSITAAPGSEVLRTVGGASTTLYIKESGTGNVGWVAK